MFTPIPPPPCGMQLLNAHPSHACTRAQSNKAGTRSPSETLPRAPSTVTDEVLGGKVGKVVTTQTILQNAGRIT